MLSSNFFYTEDLNDANIIIVNTCSVTNVADKKCLKMIRRLKREYSNAILVVAGCSSQNKQSVYESLDIDILIGNRDKSIIDKLIKEYIETEKKYVKFYNDRNLDFEDMYISDYLLRLKMVVIIFVHIVLFLMYVVLFEVKILIKL